MQKVISCKAENVEEEIEKYTDDGWKIVQMISEQVSTSVSIDGGSF